MLQKPQNAAFATNEQLIKPSRELGAPQYQQRGAAGRKINRIAAYGGSQV
jgi:hypothetical protein